LPHLAVGQSPQAVTNQPSQLKPLALPQLYWAFLSYQNHLDTLATELEAKGKDASWVRNDLQTRLGFSDADYAPIRTSSQRLTTKIAVLSRQVKKIRSTGNSATGSDQANALTALTKQRQTDVDNEIYILSQSFSPQNKEAFEAFITKFFAPKKIAFRAPAHSGLASGEAVQK
jgi:outer membrane murein-binding lipoprotein Lpp